MLEADVVDRLAVRSTVKVAAKVVAQFSDQWRGASAAAQTTQSYDSVLHAWPNINGSQYNISLTAHR